jgi:hypothetical protein
LKAPLQLMTQIANTLTAVLVLVLDDAAARGPHSVTVTVNNNLPRYDSSGEIVDAHSGSLVQVNGTFYFYGERYRNATGMDYTWVVGGYAPKLTVYTSTDLQHWTDHGLIFPNGSTTQWCPSVVYAGGRFIAWWAGFSSAWSLDGINFHQANQRIPTQLGPGWGGGEGTLFVDRDTDKGYVIFEASPTNSSLGPGHRVAIAELSADYLSTTSLAAQLFPDTFIEAPSMFKRNGTFYATYGTCCCACREGSGVVVFTAGDVAGPWMRQTGPSDVNCRNSSSPICPGSAYAPSKDSLDNAIIPAQGFSINEITTADGGTEWIWIGDRWLQGPGNNPECTNLCNKPAPQACIAGQPNYRVGRDPTYWTPLEFDAAGKVLPLYWRDSFELNLPSL